MTDKPNILNDFELGELLASLIREVREHIQHRESCNFMVIYDAERDELSLPISLGIPGNVERVSSKKWVAVKPEKKDGNA